MGISIHKIRFTGMVLRVGCREKKKQQKTKKKKPKTKGNQGNAVIVWECTDTVTIKCGVQVCW